MTESMKQATKTSDIVVDAMRQKLVKNWRENNDSSTRAIRKIPSTKDCKQVVEVVNGILKEFNTSNLTELNRLVYTAAKTIEEEIMEERRSDSQSTPPWKRRLVNKIETLRREVNQLTAARRDNGRLPQAVYRKYHLHSYNINHAVEHAKQRLTALSHRLQRYEARNEQYKINTLFRKRPQKVYEQFRRGNQETNKTMPNKDSTMKFWEEIWNVPVQHKEEAQWLRKIEEENRTLPTQEIIQVTEADIKWKLASMANWKAPGPDMVQIFWWKKFTTLHAQLARWMNEILEDPQNLPVWLVKGRTSLIPKETTAQQTPNNFRPITCLPTVWKLFSGIIANKIMLHVKRNKILYREQKGAHPGARGTKDQLAIDRTITEDSKKRRTNLAMAWIDYQKAYDSVPHSWILRCLRLYKINEKITTMIQYSMQHWKTTLTCEKEELGDIQIRRGIFQGDALSPLLFCLTMNPLSHILRREGKEYTREWRQG